MAYDPRTIQRTATPNASHGSMTVTTTDAGPSLPFNLPSGTLRLRAEPEEPEERPRVQWAEDVIDNEGMGKKSSKVCCIYHKPREAGEPSSDESSSSSSDDSDSEPDTSRAQPANRRIKRHDHRHQHDDSDHGPQGSGGDGRRDKGKGKARRPSPNAYERIPRRKGPSN
ncbi:Type 1 phosphatases regulator ypi1 [Zalaria obscura]|uniref:Type 1 phosphatases regulator ypi1 n=1 Tax=Zalaria obscura TaxID=2024903 RepID=A0ACC3SF52_9PEZI